LTNDISELRVLVLEDEPLVAMLAEEMLADLGHQAASVVHRIKDALDALEADQFDLAFLDVNLSGSLSFPVADRASEKGIPVLFVTGFSGDHMDRLARECVLQKPYTSQDLQRAIAAALEQGQPRD
jgi:CheY-like chemotaxis protein